MKLVIQPTRNILDFHSLLEILSYKDLFVVLIQRDLKLRYKQTVLGITWVILQPLLTALIFNLLFSNVIKFQTQSIPYIVFAYIGLMFWTFFSNSLTNASNSLINHEAIIRKIYFPRLIIPVATVMANIPDFVVSLVLLVILLIAYKLPITFALVSAVALGFMVVLVTSIGISLFLSAISVKYRDARFILPFFIQILLFLTPVFYPLNIVSPRNRWILSLNPMTTVIETARSVLYNDSGIWLDKLWPISIASVSACLILGFVAFKRSEKYISDVI